MESNLNSSPGSISTLERAIIPRLSLVILSENCQKSTHLSPAALIVVIGSFLLFPRMIRKQSPFKRFQMRSYKQEKKY